MSKYFKIHNFIIYIICEILKILYEVELIHAAKPQNP